MAWEKRGGERYYYRKRREGERVISEYVGAGDDAELVSRFDQTEQQRQSDARKQWQRWKAEQATLDGEIAELSHLVQTLTAAVLLASGCHRHKRQWRVRWT
jgi:hypothetical protein